MFGYKKNRTLVFLVNLINLVTTKFIALIRINNLKKKQHNNGTCFVLRLEQLIVAYRLSIGLSVVFFRDLFVSAFSSISVRVATPPTLRVSTTFEKSRRRFNSEASLIV